MARALEKQSWTSIAERAVIWACNGFTKKDLWATDIALFGQDITTTREYREADVVLIAAPYWDFSFPAQLKIYFELLCAQGVTFTYGEDGTPTALCRGTKLYYVTTVGGYLGKYNYGFDQAKALFELYFGFEESVCVAAEGLDIVTNDAAAIMDEALEAVRLL